MEISDKDGREDVQQQTHLPDDIIFQQILPWLPIKPLTRCKIVSKEWYSSISSPNFILKHTQKPLFPHLSPPIERLVLQIGNNFYLYYCDYDDNVEFPAIYNENNLVKLNFKFDVAEHDEIFLVGSSNGLICLGETFGKYFFLCNPATNESHKYYPQDFHILDSTYYNRTLGHWGFGYVSSLDDFKVVRKMFHDSTVHVFSMRNNVWQTVELGFVEDGFLNGRSQFAINEKLYWFLSCSDMSSKIVEFDFQLEKFQVFPHLAIESSRLCTMGGCLSKYRVNSQGELIIDIFRSPGRVDSLCFSSDLRFEGLNELIGFTKAGKILMINRKKLMLMDQSSNQTLLWFGGASVNCSVHGASYVPTQISLPPPAEPMPLEQAIELHPDLYPPFVVID